MTTAGEMHGDDRRSGSRTARTIVTKLRPPARHADVVRRERLIDRLARTIDRRMHVVTAPAGYGKTTLVVDFLLDAERRACWYRVDPAETDIVQFIGHVVASFDAQLDGIGRAATSLLDREEAGDPEEVLTALVNAIATHVTEPFTLVLDDFHNVDASPEVSRAVEFIATYLPSNGNVMLLARRRPPHLGLSRLAAAGEVVELGWADLRFTPDEVRRLMAQAPAEGLDADAVEWLSEAAEGWAAALVLGRMHMARDPQTARPPARGASPRLFDLLAQDVFDNEAHDIQAFMLASAILDEMSAVQCDAVLGRTDGAHMLGRIHARNLFVEQFETDPPLYRFHPLFRDFLRRRLGDAVTGDQKARPGRTDVLDPGEAQACHRRAAAWYAREGRIERELHHWLAAGDVERAAARMAEAIDRLYVNARFTTLIRLVTSLPDAMLDTYPRLQFRLSCAYESVGEPLAAVAAADRAARRFAALGDDAGLAQTLVARGTCRRVTGDIDGAVADTERGLALAADAATRLRAKRDLAQCMIARGDLDRAEALFGEALADAERAGDAGLAAHTHSDLSMMFQMRGDAARGADHALLAVSHWRAEDRPGALSLALNNLATALHAQGRRQEAEPHLRDAVRHARRAGMRRLEALALIGLADLAADRDDLATAESLYDRGVRLARRVATPTLTIYGLTMWADTLRLRDDPVRAHAQLTEARALLLRHPTVYEAALVEWARGTLALDRGDLVHAAARLEAAASGFASLGPRREHVRALLYRAVVADRAGQPDAAEAWRRAADAVMAREPFPAVFDVDVARVGRYGERRLYERRPPLAPAYGGVESAPAADAQPVAGDPASPASLRAFALGVPSVVLDGAPVAAGAWTTITARDLFFFLVDKPSGFTRDELMAAFWPDSPAHRAKSALHSTLSRVRRALGKHVVAMAADRYAIPRTPPIDYDVDQMRAFVRRAAATDDDATAVSLLDAATGLVRGEYMQGVMWDWCVERRWGIEREMTEAHLSLADACLRLRRFSEAAAAYRRVIDRDPLSETGYQGLMRALATAGDRAAAVRVYDDLARRLTAELGVDPDPHTTALYEAIRLR